MSEPPFVMSKYSCKEDLLADAAKYYKAECSRLRKALEGAHEGFGITYNALEKECYDEAMLHCGHHHAQTARAVVQGADSNDRERTKKLMNEGKPTTCYCK